MQPPTSDTVSAHGAMDGMSSGPANQRKSQLTVLLLALMLA